MRVGKWLAIGAAAVVVAGAVVTLVAWAVLYVERHQGGDLSIVNDGSQTVTVSSGDDEWTVPGANNETRIIDILDYGCTPGDVTVAFGSEKAVELSGRVCPPERIVIHDGTAEVQPR